MTPPGWSAVPSDGPGEDRRDSLNRPCYVNRTDWRAIGARWRNALAVAAALILASGCAASDPRVGQPAPPPSPASGTSTEWSAAYTLDPPSSWQSGLTREYVVHLRNQGTATWQNDGPNPVQLGVYFTQAGSTSLSHATSERHFPLPATVSPGSAIDVPVSVSAPPGPGAYSAVHRLVIEGVAWFDTFARADVTLRPPARAAAYYIGPPGGSGGTPYSSVTVTNLGEMTWKAQGETPVHLAWVLANHAPSAQDWERADRHELPADVAQGSSVTIRIPVDQTMAAADSALYTRLVQETVTWFEQEAVRPIGTVANPG